MQGPDESFELHGKNPSTTKHTWPSDTEDKENSSPRCKQLKSRAPVKQRNLISDLRKTKVATPKKAAPRDSKQTSFARALKQTHSSGGKLHIKKAHKKGCNGLLKQDKPGKEANAGEDIVLEIKAKPYRKWSSDEEQETWIKSAAGSLKLYRHRTTKKTRLVQRNPIGTVKMNLAVKDGMFGLEKVRVKQGKGRREEEVDVIQFCAVVDEEAGVEFFRLKVNPRNLDILYTELKEMGAQVKIEQCAEDGANLRHPKPDSRS